MQIRVFSVVLLHYHAFDHLQKIWQKLQFNFVLISAQQLVWPQFSYCP